MAQRAHNTLDGHPEVKEEINRLFLVGTSQATSLNTFTEQVFRFYLDTCQVSTSNNLPHSAVYHSHLLSVASLFNAYPL